jgi:ketopantoate reductase
MEISIIGPGAVGTLIGGLARLKGHGVTLRGRKPPTEDGRSLRIVLPHQWLMADGIRRQGPEDPVGNPDLFLVTLARHHLHAVRRPDFIHLIGAGDAPVAFINCDPVEPQRLAVPGERLRLCLTLMNAVRLQDADVELTSETPFLIFEKSPLLARVAKDLCAFGFQALAVDDAQPYINSFLIAQLLFLPVAMCNTTLDCFLSTPEGREMAMNLLVEGFTSMERAGMPLVSLPTMDPRELVARIERKPGSFDPAPAVPDRGYNTVLQSYLRGTPNEAAHLNRRIVEIASSAGLHLTWNWRLLQKASRVAGVGFYGSPADLLKSLA